MEAVMVLQPISKCRPICGSTYGSSTFQDQHELSVSMRNGAKIEMKVQVFLVPDKENEKQFRPVFNI